MREEPQGPQEPRSAWWVAEEPLLDAWPAGYRNCSFRVVDGGVLLFAKGKPTLFIGKGGLGDKPVAKHKRMGRAKKA